MTYFYEKKNKHPVFLKKKISSKSGGILQISWMFCLKDTLDSDTCFCIQSTAMLFWSKGLKKIAPLLVRR